MHFPASPIDRPLVIYYQTFTCPFCKDFVKNIIRPYCARSEIDLITVDVASGSYVTYMRDLVIMKSFGDSLVHDYVIAGNINPGGPCVPAVRIISPSDRRNMMTRPWIPPKYKFVFPEGSNEAFYNLVKREIEKYIIRKSYISDKRLRAIT